jgi:hypothetical protein
MSYEQPAHLNEVCYGRALAFLRRLVVILAVIMPACALIAQWGSAATGDRVSVIKSVIGSALGVGGVGLLGWLGLCFETKRRHCLEFRKEGLFLTGRGVITLRRILNWSLAQDSVEPRYTWLRITYKAFGFGRQRWSILLDDSEQTSKLRDALAIHIPQTHAP